MTITLRASCINLLSFSVALGPLIALFLLHECSSSGHMVDMHLNCHMHPYSMIVSPTWSRIWLVLYYYTLMKYCTLIEPPVFLIKAQHSN
jgi:hypothetical protein